MSIELHPLLLMLKEYPVVLYATVIVYAFLFLLDHCMWLFSSAIILCAQVFWVLYFYSWWWHLYGRCRKICGWCYCIYVLIYLGYHLYVVLLSFPTTQNSLLMVNIITLPIISKAVWLSADFSRFCTCNCLPWQSICLHLLLSVSYLLSLWYLSLLTDFSSNADDIIAGDLWLILALSPFLVLRVFHFHLVLQLHCRLLNLSAACETLSWVISFLRYSLNVTRVDMTCCYVLVMMCHCHSDLYPTMVICVLGYLFLLHHYGWSYRQIFATEVSSCNFQ